MNALFNDPWDCVHPCTCMASTRVGPTYPNAVWPPARVLNTQYHGRAKGRPPNA